MLRGLETAKPDMANMPTSPDSDVCSHRRHAYSQ